MKKILTPVCYINTNFDYVPEYFDLVINHHWYRWGRTLALLRGSILLTSQSKGFIFMILLCEVFLPNAWNIKSSLTQTTDWPVARIMRLGRISIISRCLCCDMYALIPHPEFHLLQCLQSVERPPRVVNPNTENPINLVNQYRLCCCMHIRSCIEGIVQPSMREFIALAVFDVWKDTVHPLFFTGGQFYISCHSLGSNKDIAVTRHWPVVLIGLSYRSYK